VPKTINTVLMLCALLLPTSLWAQVAVTPHPHQAELLQSPDAALAANKTLAYDFFRIILRGWHLDRTAEFLSEGYVQHNPNVPTGRQGFIDFFTQVSGGQTRPIPDQLEGLVAIQAEGELVTLSFVDDRKDADGHDYTTTWFDMFRIVGGKIVEHWDNDTK
jgi:predicted SnoaL-like aldol condensation-catalyzing enzyme